MHYSSLNSPENNFKLFIAPVTWNLGAQLWLMTKQVWPNSSWGARQGPVLGRICYHLGGNATDTCVWSTGQHLPLPMLGILLPPTALSHTHKAQGYPHLFLVKNVFYRDICIEVFSCFSSSGMPSTCLSSNCGLPSSPWGLSSIGLQLQKNTH